jgi:hypothetical protein
MQRKSTRIAKNNNLISNLTPCEKLNNSQDDYEYNYSENAYKSTHIDWISLFKLFGVIILLLPYLLIISSKIKDSNVLPKLKVLLEDSFTCPDINFICNNTQTSTPNASETKNKDF